MGFGLVGLGESRQAGFGQVGSGAVRWGQASLDRQGRVGWGAAGLGLVESGTTRNAALSWAAFFMRENK